MSFVRLPKSPISEDHLQNEICLQIIQDSICKRRGLTHCRWGSARLLIALCHLDLTSQLVEPDLGDEQDEGMNQIYSNRPSPIKKECKPLLVSLLACFFLELGGQYFARRLFWEMAASGSCAIPDTFNICRVWLRQMHPWRNGWLWMLQEIGKWGICKNPAVKGSFHRYDIASLDILAVFAGQIKTCRQVRSNEACIMKLNQSKKRILQ